MHDTQLLVEVERLRDRMMAAAEQTDNMLHRDVLLLSQSLDRLILKVQVEKRARRRSHQPHDREDSVCGQSI